MTGEPEAFAALRASLGEVPEAFAALGDMSPAAADAYWATRSEFFRDRPDGLTPALKEGIIVLLEVLTDNEEGAARHARAAQQLGLSDAAMEELMLAILMFFGMSKWAPTGSRTWAAWRSFGDGSSDG